MVQNSYVAWSNRPAGQLPRRLFTSVRVAPFLWLCFLPRFVWLCLCTSARVAPFLWLCLFTSARVALFLWLYLFTSVLVALFVWFRSCGSVCLPLLVWLCSVARLALCILVEKHNSKITISVVKSMRQSAWIGCQLKYEFLQSLGAANTFVPILGPKRNTGIRKSL